MDGDWLNAVKLDGKRERNKGAQGWAVALCFAAMLALFIYMYLHEMQITNDMQIHAGIAAEFNFLDLHSITCRLAYPVWHICVRTLQYLGLALNISAALVTAAFKLATMALVYRLYRAMLGGSSAWKAALAAALVMVITGIRISTVNPYVYMGTSSPNVWHNPTQITVSFTMLLCIPYTMHCWYEFLRVLPEQGERATLPWKKVVCLAILLVFSTLCKPTFMQALIPAAFVFFLVQWIRHPRNSRYFGQIILAYVPVVVCFLVQYLYYTGVLVPYTSGVSIGVTLDGVLFILRAMLMMAAFPFACLLCLGRKELRRDSTLTLTLLLVFFAMLEAIAFRETGMRANDGNFTWGCSSAALMMWIVMTPKYLLSLRAWRGTGDTPALSIRQKIGCALATGLLLWHIASAAYYVYYLLSSGSAY